MPEDKRLVEIYRAASDMEAQVIKSLLDSYEIPCIFHSNSAPSAHGFLGGNAMGPIDVLVREDMAEQARQLVQEETS